MTGLIVPQMDASEAEIREAYSDADDAAAATLMAAYLTWAHDRLREEYGVQEEPADPSQVAAALGAYRRPSGVLLLAEWSAARSASGPFASFPAMWPRSSACTSFRRRARYISAQRF